MVSTIEHIGLNVYGQLTLDDEGDIKAMRELHRIMKPGGLLIITTPYTGQTLRISEFERNYSRQRLIKLIKGFKVASRPRDSSLNVCKTMKTPRKKPNGIEEALKRLKENFI